MDRFFSKLDLRDIKIKPEGTRFLPTDDDLDATEPSSEDLSRGYVADSPLSSAPTFERTWQPTEPASHYVETIEVETLEVVEFVEVSNEPEPVAQNGRAHAQAIDSSQPLFDNGEVLKVSAKSRPSAVAGAIAGVVRDAGRAEVQAIGAGATNQAVKAVAIARDYLLESGIDAVCVPAFIDVVIDNEERTAIRLVVETR
jgi:stage V sporulation protein S